MVVFEIDANSPLEIRLGTILVERVLFVNVFVKLELLLTQVKDFEPVAFLVLLPLGAHLLTGHLVVDK